MYRYTLEPYKGPASRYTCPQCHHKRTFSRYIDTGTNLHLDNHIGRCSRESKCGYHCKPERKSIVDRPWIMVKKNGKQHPPPTANHRPSTMDHGLKTPSTMDHGLLEKSLTGYTTNIFTNWLVKLFGEQITEELIGRYLIGTSKHWPGATVFWQIAADGGIRTGKIMLYGDDGKRIKKPFNHITWVHALLSKSENVVDGPSTTELATSADYTLGQCFFGEHLLKEEPLKPVAIVESEKSAIVAGVYLPGFTWLAAGALSNLNAEKCHVLKGRNVTLFPDLNCFDKWQQKATAMGMGFKVSPLLELSANDDERAAGLDLADYLLTFDYREFITPIAKPEQASPQNYSIGNHQPILKLFAQTFGCDTAQVQFSRQQIYKRPVWDSQIDELQAYFNSTALPAGPIRLNSCSVINDVGLFVKNHLDMVRHNNGNSWHNAYLQRLMSLKTCLENA